MASELSEYKVNEIILGFCQDLTASQTSQILRTDRKTINKYFNLFKEVTFRYSREQSNSPEAKEEEKYDTIRHTEVQQVKYLSLAF